MLREGVNSMGSTVKKVFITLGTIVACVILIAFVLNNLMPNVVRGVVNATETMIYNATGLKMDFNGDGIDIGDNEINTDADDDDDPKEAGVEGFTP